MRCLCLASDLWNDIGYDIYLALNKQLNCIVFLLLYGKYFKRFLRCSCYQRKKGKPFHLNAIPTNRPTPLKNAAIETPQVIAVCVSRHVSITPMIVSNCFIFANHKQQIHEIKMPQFQSSFSTTSFGSCGANGSRSGKPLLALSLYIILVFI